MIRYFVPTAVALGLCLTSPSVAFAQAQAKQTPARSVDVKKVFPFYDMYLRLPAEGRDGFRMEYKLNGTQRPQAFYALGGTRTPMQLAPNGVVLNLPDANMLNNGKIEIAAGQPRTSISMNLEPVVPLSRRIATSDAANPLNDYSNAVRRAGPLAAFAPKVTGVVFKGVSSGEVVFGDGRQAQLGAGDGGLVFRPALPAMRGAVALTFPNAPSSVEFSK